MHSNWDDNSQESLIFLQDSNKLWKCLQIQGTVHFAALGLGDLAGFGPSSPMFGAAGLSNLNTALLDN